MDGEVDSSAPYTQKPESWTAMEFFRFSYTQEALAWTAEAAGTRAAAKESAGEGTEDEED